MVLYEKYKETRDAAWQCLIENEVRELPVKVTDIIKRYGIRIVAYGDATNLILRMKKERCLSEDGFCVNHNGRFIIYYNENIAPNRLRFTLAHELGHITIGYIMYAREHAWNGHNFAEQEANMFAARLLMPACVLHEIKAITPEKISKICAVSLESAKIRSERMALLERRGAWYKSPLEIQVREQFRDWITEYNRRP